MGDLLSSYISVSIGGTNLSKQQLNHISDITFSWVVDGSDSLAITLNDPLLEHVEDDIYVEDAYVSAKVGLVSGMARKEFRGYIVAIDPDFPEDGVPVLVVTCMDERTYKMNREKKKRTWDDCSRADVAQQIAAEYGLKFYRDPSYEFDKLEVVTQSDQTDIDFLESMANEEREPFMAKVMNGALHYKRLGVLTPAVIDLEYRTGACNIRTFKPSITTETIKKEVVKSDVNAGTKKVSEYTKAANERRRKWELDPALSDNYYTNMPTNDRGRELDSALSDNYFTNTPRND